MIFVFLLVSIIAGLYVYRTPAACFAFVLCMFALEQWVQSKSSFFVEYPWLINVAVGGLVLLALIVKRFRGEKLIPAVPVIGWLVVLLYVYALASLSWTPRSDLALVQWVKGGPLIIVSFLLPLVVRSYSDLIAGQRALLIVGPLTLVLLVFFGGEWQGRKLILETTGTLSGNQGNPLAIANCAAYTIITIVLFNFQRGKLYWEFFRWFVVVIGLILVIRSGSRGQLMGLFISIFLMIPVGRRIDHPVRFMSLMVGLGGMVAIFDWVWSEYATGIPRWTEEGAMDSVDDRLEMISILLRYWWNTPLSWFPGLGNSASFDPTILGFYPHNVIVEILAEEGLVGFALFIAIMVGTGYSFWHLARKVRLHQEAARSPLAILGAIMIFHLILSMKQGSLLGNSILFAAAIMISRISLIERRKAVKEKVLASRRSLLLGANLVGRYFNPR